MGGWLSREMPGVPALKNVSAILEATRLAEQPALTPEERIRLAKQEAPQRTEVARVEAQLAEFLGIAEGVCNDSRSTVDCDAECQNLSR
jgi:hypothetical protein